MLNKISIFFISILIHSHFVLCQELELRNSEQISGIGTSTVGKNQNVFIAQDNGDILKLDNTGKTSIVFSPTKIGKVKQIDVWSPYKVILFYESLQEIVVLNRFLAETSRIDLKTFELGYISNATLNFQQNIWLVDESDFSLKLIDSNTGETLIKQPFFQFLDVDNHEIDFIKEYQGLLYVVDRHFGFLIFDSLGTLIDKMEQPNIGSIGFEKDEMYFLSHGKLVMRKLYSPETREITFPQSNYISIHKSSDYFFCMTSNQLDIYRYLRED